MDMLEKDVRRVRQLDLNQIVKEGAKRAVRLDDELVGVIYLGPNFGLKDTTLHETEFCVEQDATGAANYSTVVHQGQLFYLRSTSGNSIKIEFKPGLFVDPDTGAGYVDSTIELPANGNAVKVRVNPNGILDDPYFIRAQGAGNGHGSPTLIIRKPPIGSD